MSDNQVILAVALTLIVFLSVLANLFIYRNVKQSVDLLLSGVERKEIKTVLENQFGRLDPQTQSNFLKLLNIADPLTTLSPTDLDDRVMKWLKDITDKNPNT